MKGIKEPVHYYGVSLPVPLVKEVTNFVKASNRYRSVGEFIRQATREKLDSELKNVCLENISKDELKKLIDESVEQQLKELKK